MGALGIRKIYNKSSNPKSALYIILLKFLLPQENPIRSYKIKVQIIQPPQEIFAREF